MQSKYKKVGYNQERAQGRQIVMPQLIEQDQRKSEFISRLQNDVGLSVKKIDSSAKVTVYAYLAAVWGYFVATKIDLLDTGGILVIAGCVIYQIVDFIGTFVTLKRIYPLITLRRYDRINNKDIEDVYEQSAKFVYTIVTIKVATAIFSTIAIGYFLYSIIYTELK